MAYSPPATAEPLNFFHRLRPLGVVTDEKKFSGPMGYMGHGPRIAYWSYGRTCVRPAGFVALVQPAEPVGYIGPARGPPYVALH